MSSSSTFAPWSAEIIENSSQKPETHRPVIASMAQDDQLAESPREITTGPSNENSTSPWYVPTSSTIFPKKKGDLLVAAKRTLAGKINHNANGNLDKSPDVEQAARHYVNDEELSREEEVRQSITNLPEDFAPLRRRASIQSLVAAIGDEESRRLTALAYLS
ncbi:SubName: Full=Uncharacterized protein {ECO:0000313/EMBL:CCA77019.1} [Serendipita indica DSM 11827]|uniref:Uncharacterized protein n=1 Tax=Serendipita indica (strain DSM 11827) TaxID=1109443 RepID=G4U0C6_SERID|nr:SubName: Full=Uncharacterized protein {ECO:0000313/EMBL:CCA77019.1} [Serendipita indica DSM 11827]CCA77019.1 hypothetical protein PIIN_11004 [Serendipita indica DSM 11827]